MQGSRTKGLTVHCASAEGSATHTPLTAHSSFEAMAFHHSHRGAHLPFQPVLPHDQYHLTIPNTASTPSPSSTSSLNPSRLRPTVGHPGYPLLLHRTPRHPPLLPDVTPSRCCPGRPPGSAPTCRTRRGCTPAGPSGTAPAPRAAWPPALELSAANTGGGAGGGSIGGSGGWLGKRWQGFKMDAAQRASGYTL